MGCRRPAPKHELLRIARTPGAGVRADPVGSSSGRGAYVHRADACVTAALHGGIARALRTGLDGKELSRLTVEIGQQMGAS